MSKLTQSEVLALIEANGEKIAMQTNCWEPVQYIITDTAHYDGVAGIFTRTPRLPCGYPDCQRIATRYFASTRRQGASARCHTHSLLLLEVVELGRARECTQEEFLNTKNASLDNPVSQK